MIEINGDSQRFPVLVGGDPYWFTAHDILDDDK